MIAIDAIAIVCLVALVLVGREYLDRWRTHKLLRRLDRQDRQDRSVADIFRR